MRLVKLRKDVRLIPAKNRVLVFSNEGHLCLEGRESIRLVGRLAPLLSPAAAEDKVLEAFAGKERGRAADVLRRLRQSGMLSEVKAGDARGAGPRGPVNQPNVTFIGHATLLVETGGKRILTDPWLFAHNKQINRRPHPITFADLPALDYICISHEHSDHLNLPTLMRLDKKVPVIVPKIESPGEFNRSLETSLARLGFERIICLETWQSFEDGGLKITRTPCHKAWRITEQATWLVQSPELVIFCGNDMMEDEPFMRRLGETHDIDIAFLPISGYTQCVGQLPFKQFWPPETHDQVHRDVMGISEAVEATKWMKPRFAAGYANGGAYWYKHPEGSLTEGPADEFVALLRKENPCVGGLDLKPGDVWAHDERRIVRYGGAREPSDASGRSRP